MFVDYQKVNVKFPKPQNIRIFWKDCSAPDYFIANYLFFSVAGLFQIWYNSNKCGSDKCETFDTERIEKIEIYENNWKEICKDIVSYNRFNSFWEKLW